MSKERAEPEPRPVASFRRDVIRLSAALRVGTLLVLEPGVGFAKQLGHRQQVVGIEAVGLLPGLVALAVAAGRVRRVVGASLADVAPYDDLQDSVADFVCWL